MNEYLPLANLMLNLLIIPLLVLLNGIKIELTKLNGRIQNHDERIRGHSGRIDRIERIQDQ